MRINRALILLLLFLTFAACDDSFDVNADWKEVMVVYGLLNPSAPDSVNYIRINRGFVNDDMSALDLAKVPDSISYTDSLYVLLQIWKNGVHQKGQDIVLTKIPNNNKDTGYFATEGQFLFATPKQSVLDINAVYKLVIRNTVTGKEVSSATEIVGNMASVFPRVGNRITFTPRNELDMVWLNGINAYFYDVQAVIYYNEFKRAFPFDKELKTINWPLVRSMRTRRPDVQDEMKIRLYGIDFFNMLKDNIDVDYNMDREFLRIDFVFSAGGEEIQNYINVNKPSIGIVQKKPEYSNIENGLGIFSSRNQNILKIQITNSCLQEIQNSDLTRDLNFIR